MWLLTATLLVFVEGNGLISRCEEDVSPLLQLARTNTSHYRPDNATGRGSSGHLALHSSPALMVLNGPSNKTHPLADSRQNATDSDRTFVDSKDAALPFFGPTALPQNGTTDDGKKITRRMREKQLGREAVSAAALIMILISFSVGLQLVMVEFVMTGTCAIPVSIAGMVLAVFTAITKGLRATLRFLLRPFRSPANFLWECFCTVRKQGKAQSISQALPEPLIEEVVTFLSLDGMCELGCASRKCKDWVNTDHCFPALMKEVTRNGLEHRWQRYSTRLKAAGSDSSCSEVSEVQGKEKSSQTTEKKAPKNLIKEMRGFLCKQLRRSKAKAEAKEVNERWNVIADVVRYIMLVIGWFWFSAEVMDMACLEGGGPWQIIKAVSSPCLFMFILESDRSHFWWQLVAGIVATVLLLDLLFA